MKVDDEPSPLKQDPEDLLLAAELLTKLSCLPPWGTFDEPSAWFLRQAQTYSLAAQLGLRVVVDKTEIRLML